MHCLGLLGMAVGSAVIAVLPAVVAVGNSTPAAFVALEDRYRKATTLQATFLERYSENGKQVKVEAGTAYFLRPGKMRWEYEQPEKSLFLVDGKYVWFYAPADHTATRMPARKSDWRTPICVSDDRNEVGENLLNRGTGKGCEGGQLRRCDLWLRPANGR